MLKDWKHSGFSIESETRLFSKADREALGQYVVRGATCADKIHYDPASDTVIWTAAPKGFYKGKSETFKGFEFVDQLVAHLPPRRVQLVRRYGVYAGKVRKQWQERPNIYCLAPESWQKGHPSQSQIVQAKAPENEEAVQVPDAWWIAANLTLFLQIDSNGSATIGLFTIEIGLVAAQAIAKSSIGVSTCQCQRELSQYWHIYHCFGGAILIQKY